MKEIIKQLAKLLTIKSLVTISLTAVFCFLAATGQVGADLFLTVYTVIIAFYFGTQYERGRNGDPAATITAEQEEAADK